MPVRELSAEELEKRASRRVRELTREELAAQPVIGMPGAAAYNAAQAAAQPPPAPLWDPSRVSGYSGPTGPGGPASYLRGLTVEGPAQIAGAAGTATDALVGLGGRLGLPGALAVGDLGASKTFEEGARGGLSRAIPIPPPVSPAEKTAQAAGIGTAFAAPAAFLGPTWLAPWEIGAATAGGALGEELRQGAEQAKYGELGQAVAQGAGDMFMSMAPMGIVARSPQIANSAGRILRSMKPSAEAMAEAQRMGVSIRDLYKAAGEFKAFVPNHPSGDERYVEEWIRYLDEALARFPDDAMPTTRQVIDAARDAGSPLASLDEGLGRRFKGYAMDSLGRRQAAEDAIRGELDFARGTNLDTNLLPRMHEAVRDRAWNAQKQMWDLVPPEQIPNIPTAGLKEGAREAIKRAGEFKQDIPPEAAMILEWGDTIPWEQYQQFRSRLLKVQRIGKRPTAETMSQLQTDNRAPIIEAFQNELDNLVKAHGGIHQTADEFGVFAPLADASDAYGNALRATANFYDRFSPTSVVTRGYEDMTKVQRITSNILGAKRPGDEVTRAMRVFAQEPGGVETFRRSLYDAIVGPDDLNFGTIKTAMGKLRANEEAARAAWGDAGYEAMIDLLERARIIGFGKTGKSAQAMSVGSGASNVDDLTMSVGDFFHPTEVTRKALTAAQKRVMRNQVTPRILREAAMHPRTARLLLSLPEPRAVEAWEIKWKALAARASARAAATSQAGKE